MDINKFKNKPFFKFLLLIILFLFFFYFFIFKNIINLVGLNDSLNVEKNRNIQLYSENKKLKQILKLKQDDYKKYLKTIKNKDFNSSKKIFKNLSDFFIFLNNHMNKNNINFKNFARSRKNQNSVLINFSFSASEKDTFNFIYDIENSIYFLNLANFSFSMDSFENSISSQFSIFFKIKERNYELNKFLINDSTPTKEIFKKNFSSDNSSSYIRIGNNKFYFKKNLDNTSTKK